MSVYSSADSDYTYSAEKTIEILFNKMRPLEGHKTVHDLMQVIYRLKPECFEPIGALHNSEDGKETYQTVRVWIAKGFYHNVHIYGIMRGKYFRIMRSEVLMKHEKYTVIFNRPEQIGGGGGGGGNFAHSGCPW